MIGKGPVVSDSVQKLLTHKDYVVRMVNSIIKETELDPCAGYTTEDLGASSLYDLSRVCICHFEFASFSFTYLLTSIAFTHFRHWYR